MQTKHTPGPWYVSTPGRTDVLYVGPVAVSSHRTALGSGASNPECLSHIDDDSLHANANLIAAAPDLIEALSSLISQINGFQECNGDKDFDLVDSLAAIAKATGGAA